MVGPLEEQELSHPVPRKQISPSRTIYLSRLMRPKPGPMLLSDFGEARLGPGPHNGDIMPIQYRAPEVIMGIPWNYPVDIWSVGLTVSMPLESNPAMSDRCFAGMRHPWSKTAFHRAG